MPLIQIKDIDDQASWALWKIAEDLDELGLLPLCDQEKTELDQIHNEKKRMEWLAARTALQHIFGNNNIGKMSILKDGHGKPFLHGAKHQISLAHSFPYAVALFNRMKPAGIDMEKVQQKILKISNKFLNVPEMEIAGGNLTKLTILWCAKEALYKLYGRRRIIFKENLFISPFELRDEGELMGSICIDESTIQIPLHYLMIEDFVVCYTK